MLASARFVLQEDGCKGRRCQGVVTTLFSSVEAGQVLFALAIRVLLAGLFLYLYRRKRGEYLLYWAAGWTLMALRWLAQLVALTQDGQQGLLKDIDALLLALGVLLFLDSARVFGRERAFPVATHFGTPLFLVLWLVHVLAGDPYTRVVLTAVSGLVLVATATLFWKQCRRREIAGGAILTGALIFWGVDVLVSPLSPLLTPDVGMVINFLLSLPRELVAFGMLIVLYEEEKRTLERHMLGLAGLNLITSTAQRAATVQDMLGQTLERVLGALRVPSGAFAVRLQEEEQMTSIHRGQDGFLQALEREGLLAYLQRTVSRLGGLVVLPDLNNPAAPAAFAHEQEFARVARLAQADRVRLVVGVSLRAKTGDRGVLLLASPRARHLAPAELRLLLGLGGQVGMAVENFHLQQQSSRRTEELRLLNETGRALSSVRSLDAIFERIHSEMRKVLDVSDFYVALFDAQKDEVSFELEVKDGAFLPKRRRRSGNGITEYVIRTKRPLLIPKEFERVVAELGVEPGRTAHSLCAVPILLHGEGIGVIGIVGSSPQKSFDQAHVEVLTILAAQTAVAVENARLFGEEQKRGLQLSLLNNVARKAISTLNPEEMLAAIAAEVYTGLPYDYVGLGMLDYSNREVVIHAEGEQGTRGLNRRFKLGEGSVGRVATGGAMERIDHLAGSAERAESGAVLPNAQSLVTLPIVYADQLLGVLHVESRNPQVFLDEDVLLLRTLADQVASALHNAFAFQKAQEQAITDGLTGVKTHRFFMEALHSEWRRATRVGRGFSLLMLDLDNFKFVNDYFGHLEGDVVLQRMGRILEQNVRRSDVVARYGGDEFVVLMPETTSDQAYGLSDKLRQWLANDPMLREKKITGSLGIATYPQHATTPQELIQVADASMYLSKHQGGNMIVSADHYRLNEQKQWQRHVLEAYLGVTIKRLFATGPEAFDEVYQRLEQVVGSLGAPSEGQELPPAVLETVTSLAFAIDAKDHYTQGHSQNVARYCLSAARQMKFSEKAVEEVRLAAVLHDVGKIGVPERILNKPGPLDADEFELMKQHTVLGSKILEPLRSIPNIQKIVRHHHERWDGSGYPDGLKGDATPMPARLIAIADAFDTMTSERTYKRSRTRQEAVEELRRCAGSQFDPALVQAFLDALSVEAIAPDERPPLALV